MKRTDVAVLVVVAAGVASLNLMAQAPAYEVALVKPNKSGSQNSGTSTRNGQLTATNVTLRAMIRNAYGLQDFQIAGGPGWVDSDRFDIIAKAEGEPSPADRRLMMQALLAERFTFASHHGSTNINNTVLKAQGRTIADFAQTLSSIVARIVIDKTGLDGAFDIDLVWSRDQTTDTTQPSIFTALQEQLGLKLDPSRGPLDVLVIDHVEPPTPD